MRLIPACAAALTVLSAAGSAGAHVRLLASDPAPGAVVAHAPQRLELRLNQVPRLAGTGVELTAPDGRRRLLKLERDPGDVRRLVAPLPASMAPGLYQVHWRALSPLAHRTEGRFSFRVGPR